MSRKDRIQTLLHTALHPKYLLVEDESNKHHVPEGAETHFKLTVVAEVFNSLAIIGRHRIINKLLTEELQTGLHAMSLHLYTPKEWESRSGTTAKTPECRDGYRH